MFLTNELSLTIAIGIFEHVSDLELEIVGKRSSIRKHIINRDLRNIVRISFKLVDINEYIKQFIQNIRRKRFLKFYDL